MKPSHESSNDAPPSSNIRSIIRVRPSKNADSYLACFRGEKEVTVHPTIASASTTLDMYRDTGSLAGSLPTSQVGIKRFTYDEVFPPEATQEAVFEEIGRPVVENVLKGYNATVLSYGQTGSGKTYTMLGPSGGQAAMIRQATPPAESGLIPRILCSIFAALDERCPSTEQGGNTAEMEYTVTVGVAELYNETLADLTHTFGVDPTTPSPPSAPDLKIREDRSPGGRGIFMDGLSYHRVETVGKALDVIAHANERKSMGVTKMNETSSRSHTIVNVRVDIINLVNGGSKTSSEMFLVDLAGSERVGKTGATGDRLKEAQGINLSLTLLGNVISKLTDNSVHIPYRDAKLTRLLQDSLGGNALTTLVCTCAPEPDHLPETLSSLQFAQRAKQIKNKPMQNVSLSPSELQDALRTAQAEIRSLQERVRVLASLGSSTATPGKDASDSDLRATISSLLRENQELKEEVHDVRADFNAMKKSVNFHSQQEQAARAETKILQGRLESETAALLKAKEELARLALKTSNKQAPVAPAVAKKSMPRGPTPKRSSSIGAAATKQPVPMTRQVTPPSEQEGSVDTGVLKYLELHDTVNKLKKQLEEHGKYVVLVDSQQRELDAAKKTFENRLEALTYGYEEKLTAQSRQIEAMEKKIDKESDDEGNNPEKLANAIKINERLQHENDELHSENRINAMRMYELARQIDTLQDEVRVLKEGRDQMKRDIDMHAMADSELRRKLLATLNPGGKENGKNREYFRKRFFECLDVPAK